METGLQRNIDLAAEMMLKARYVVAMTGAGVSVESGIRAFRGPGGLWNEYGEPPMDGYDRFLADPAAHWRQNQKREGFARELFETLERAVPNEGHFALAELEKLSVVKFLITQNVDNLHRLAGSVNIAEIHGNMFLLRCIKCHSRYHPDEIPLEALPPHCPKCGGIVKTDGVMFGEPIPTDVLAKCQEETDKCDLMLVAGTSSFVYPAAGFPLEVQGRGGALIEVNLYGSDLTPQCRLSLRGKFGEVLPALLESVKGSRQ